MSDYTRLMARDGHQFAAWLAPPKGPVRGAVLVLQEIFGVNAHIREVADGFAAEGYLAIAPCLFDRVDRDLQLGYTPDDITRGRGTMLQLKQEQVTLDIAASLAVVKHAGRAAAIGYCWGGTQAWLAAVHQPVAAAVAYYGTGIAANLDVTLKAPVQCHFGTQDKSIPPEAVERIRAAQPAVDYHLYNADHGFSCDHRGSYDAASAALARTRTLAFLAEHLS
jgi:carboxymethylenebutenolidase